MRWVFDLDGVVWLAGRPIPGSPEAIARLRAAGHGVAFVTNNSGPTIAEHAAALAAAGVPAAGEEIVTSAQAAAAMVDDDARVAVVGDEGITEALRARGVHPLAATDDPDVVIVGRTLELDYDRLAAAATAIRDGARFVATNTDSTFPAGGALLPGAGALVAFLATAAGRQPQVAGKPHQPVADLVRDRYGAVDMVVGDRADTDGRFARLVGARFGLVLSGVTRQEDLPVDPAPDLVSEDLAGLVQHVLDG
jgi:HAD superfamily hydrolase (TIGR01450 family)